jgi:hypothetical protein
MPISFPEEMHEWLRQAAFTRRMKMAELVREAVSQYRMREEPQLGLPLSPGEETVGA